MLRACAILLVLWSLLLAAPACAASDSDEPEPFLTIDSSDFIDWCEDTYCFRPAIGLYYNRVDGVLSYLGVQYRNDEHLYPRFRAVRGWTSAHEAGYYQVDFEQPIHSQDAFSLGVSFYEKTDWSRQDDESISDFANNLLAILARVDHRDYFRRDGITYFAQLKATPNLMLRLELRRDELSSMETRESVWSVFRRDDDWEANPPLMTGNLNAPQTVEVLEGSSTMRSFCWSMVYDNRNPYERTGWTARWLVEFAGGNVGGDYEFRRHEIGAKRLFRVTDKQTLSLAGGWGVGTGTDFPSHKLFFLGGEANLRGYEWKEFSGKNMVFGRAEYAVRVWPDFQVIGFYDTGSAWYSGGEVASDLLSDIGVGFRFDAPGLGEFRLDIARAATTEDAAIMVDFQLYY
jgi:outer membrane protein assembly factor BamA